MKLKIFMTMALAVALALSTVGAAFAAPPPQTVRVDENGDADWGFNLDPGFVTDYEFGFGHDTVANPIGNGSLHVGPIENDPTGADKFIAAHRLEMPASDLSSISYDFLIAGTSGDPGDADKFYLNVYTNLPGSSTFYDCRFDLIPATGSTTAYTTATFETDVAPSRVASRGGATCPTTLSGMPEGSTVSFFTLNVGDTGTADTALEGYLDNVVVETALKTTVYDFEANKDICRDGGHADHGFANQGQCVSAAQANGKSGK